jgi:L-ribulose-5-phosphate 3-epimerase
MKDRTTRRQFFKASAGAAAGASLATLSSAHPAARAGGSALAAVSPPAPDVLPIQKGVLLGMLPQDKSYADRFKIARDTGFEVVQASTTADPRVTEEIKTAADGAGIRIDSVMNEGHWEWPLSSSDPAVVGKSLKAMETSLHNAKFWGSDAVLLVPGVVNPNTSYRDAWTRSQENIRKLIPLAEELKVVIAIEEVWNKFLLSPLEMAAYVDEFKSPWVKAWFDVGNVVLYGYPQDWIRTLGSRIYKVHLKDFKRLDDAYFWVNLGEGDIDWSEVHNAFKETGFTGSATVELEGGKAPYLEPYLRDVSSRVDRLLLGKA